MLEQPGGLRVLGRGLLLTPSGVAWPAPALARRVGDLLRPPSWAEVAPMMKNGIFLSTRSLLAMGMLMWATRLIAGFGAVGLAGESAPARTQAWRGGLGRWAHALTACFSAPGPLVPATMSTRLCPAPMQPTRFCARSGCSATRPVSVQLIGRRGGWGCGGSCIARACVPCQGSRTPWLGQACFIPQATV